MISYFSEYDDIYFLMAHDTSYFCTSVSRFSDDISLEKLYKIWNKNDV